MATQSTCGADVVPVLDGIADVAPVLLDGIAYVAPVLDGTAYVASALADGIPCGDVKPMK